MEAPTPFILTAGSRFYFILLLLSLLHAPCPMLEAEFFFFHPLSLHALTDCDSSLSECKWWWLPGGWSIIIIIIICSRKIYHSWQASSISFYSLFVAFYIHEMIFRTFHIQFPLEVFFFLEMESSCATWWAHSGHNVLQETLFSKNSEKNSWMPGSFYLWVLFSSLFVFIRRHSLGPCLNRQWHCMQQSAIGFVSSQMVRKSFKIFK